MAVTPIHDALTDHRSFADTRGLRIDGFETGVDELGEGPIGYAPHPRSECRRRTDERQPRVFIGGTAKDGVPWIELTVPLHRCADRLPG